MVCSTDRSKAVVPVLVLLFVALWFILRGDLFYVFPCVILFLCLTVLLVLRLPRLGKRERANLSAFRTFVRFVLVYICRFPLPLGVWEGLRFVIVALPGLFSYLFFYQNAYPVTAVVYGLYPVRDPDPANLAPLRDGDLNCVAQRVVEHFEGALRGQGLKPTRRHKIQE